MFNCFVDIWDNYNDYHKAVDTDDYQKNTNIIGRENLSMGLIKSLLAFFFFGSLILGIIVALMTGWAVFWLGLCWRAKTTLITSTWGTFIRFDNGLYHFSDLPLYQ